ncbi:UDP-N-acetylglucosamine transporter TMEM241 homolog [Haliotis asinina]|uniref:UDP-N-acetylglucosamine transporter TMEM241 homolog n=1 Tax=Haliotis asinina TaxID=109174 RepID=UPI003531C885
MLPETTTPKQPFQLILFFCFLFVATNFVNKYVLSVLKFTYPTIFQGWQTLVGALLLRILMVTGHLENLLSTVRRQDIAVWLPGMMLFVTSIYSGSRALANLAVPVFFSMQNLTIVIKWTGELAINRQLTGIYVYGMLMLTTVSSIAIIKTDPQLNSEGYFWMSIHVISSGLIDVYTNLMKGRLKLNCLERLYSSYIYSVIILGPSSYFIGDALEAAKFPYLYFSKFYVGCILSGVLGMFLNLLSIRLQEEEEHPLDYQASLAISKIVGSLLSLLFFDIQVVANQALWITVNHLGALASSKSLTARTAPQVMVEDVLPHTHPNIRRDNLQQDLLRTEVA